MEGVGGGRGRRTEVTRRIRVIDWANRVADDPGWVLADSQRARRSLRTRYAEFADDKNARNCLGRKRLPAQPVSIAATTARPKRPAGLTLRSIAPVDTLHQWIYNPSELNSSKALRAHLGFPCRLTHRSRGDALRARLNSDVSRYMPIVDVEFLSDSRPNWPVHRRANLQQRWAARLVRRSGARGCPSECSPLEFYAENEAALSSAELPVLVTVLHARPPVGPALAAEVAEPEATVAACVGRPPERVHVQITPAATGRQAFGGVLR